MWKAIVIGAGCLALAAGLGDAAAFEVMPAEKQTLATQKEGKDLAKLPPKAGAKPLAGLSGSKTPKAPSGEDDGIDIWIPGLGVVGKMPRFDFGLELLYGSDDQKGAVTPDDQVPDEELTIRGTLKHRF